MPEPAETSMVDEVKRFVKKYQLPIVITATAVVTYTVARKANVKDVTIRELGRTIHSMRLQWNEAELENLTFLEFMDHKGLRDEYFAFFKKQNG